jgi:hypothetical protein
MGRSAVRSTAMAVIVIALVGMLGVGLGELVLRWFPGLLPPESALRVNWREIGAAERAARDQYILPDEQAGFLYAPHAESRIARGDLDFTFRTDSRGFRNPEPWPDRAEIVVLGDSMAFGYGVDNGFSFPALMRERLLDTRIINLSVIGAGPPQYVEVFERFGATLRPQTVLLALFPGNDVIDAEVFAEWVAAGRPVPYYDWRYHGTGRNEGSRLEALLSRSYLLILVREGLRVVQHGSSNRSITLDDGGPLVLAPSAYERTAGTMRRGDPRFERVVELLERFAARLAADGHELRIVMMPTKEEVYLPTLGIEPPRMVEAFVDELTSRGLTVIDPTPMMVEAAARGERLYHAVDGHPTGRGYEVIAETVAAALGEAR